MTDRRREWELESLMESVLVDGLVITTRAKLAALLGRTRERSEVWSEIKEAYEAVGGEANHLWGKRFGSQIVLARFQLERDPYDSVQSHPFDPQARG